MSIVALLAVAAVVGVMIGAVGVGGVLLAPVLVTATVMDAHAATATSCWVFVFTGVAGTWRYARQEVVPWDVVGRLAVGVGPAALVGAFTNQLLPGGVVLFGVAALALFAGVNALRAQRRSTPRDLGTAAVVGIGAAVGCGSAITGTGGPVLLVPVLLVLGFAPLVAVAASQVIQLPVVVVASVGFLWTGGVDLRLGTVLGLVAAVGVLAGSAVAGRAGVDHLRVAIGMACCIAGVLLVGRSTITVLSS